MKRAIEWPINYGPRPSNAHTLMVEVFLGFGAAIGVGLTAIILRAVW